MVRIDTPTLATPVTLDKAHQDLKKATQQFESYFLHEMLKEMRKTVPADKLLADDGNGKEIFQDMMDQKLSENMADRGDFGIAKVMYDQLAPALNKTAAVSQPAAVKPISFINKGIGSGEKTREELKFTR